MAKFVTENNTVKINGILDIDPSGQIVFQNEDDVESKIALKDLISKFDGFSISATFTLNKEVI